VQKNLLRQQHQGLFARWPLHCNRRAASRAAGARVLPALRERLSLRHSRHGAVRVHHAALEQCHAGRTAGALPRLPVRAVPAGPGDL